MLAGLNGAALRRVIVLSWIPIAFAAQLTIALIGILCAYLQVKPVLPSPALRLVLVLNIFGEATLLCFHAIPTSISYCWKRRKDQSTSENFADSQEAVLQQPTLHAGEDAAAACTSASVSSGDFQRPTDDYGIDSGAGEKSLAHQASVHCDGQPEIAGKGSDKGPGGVQRVSQLETHAGSQPPNISPGLVPLAEPPPKSFADRVEPPRCPARAPQDAAWAAWLPQVLHSPLASTSRAIKSKYSILLLLAATSTASTGLQVMATGFVDPAIVQLVAQFSAVLTAVVDTAFLGHPLLWTIWPCAFIMTGGAAMVITPSVGHDVAGSLSTGRGWLGFSMAVIGLICSVAYYMILQANSNLGFSATFIQYCSTTLSILAFMTLSLPIDGTDWSRQFAGWSAGDWLLLVFCGAADAAVGVVLELSTWRLGASMVAMTKSSRLIFSVILTKPVLGTTAISSGLQIAGVVLTAVALTAFIGSHWWDTRKAQQKLPSQQQEGHSKKNSVIHSGIHRLA